jgi:tetratricopeptide (TPR) repeat protein
LDRGPRAVLFAALLSAAAAYAQGDLMGQAGELLRSGRSAEAYQLLESHEVENAGNPAYDVMFAKAANRVGEHTRAIMALERVLAQQPNNLEARNEMGIALAAVGDRKAARQLLEESRARGVDMISGASVDQLLQAISRIELEGVSSFRAYVEASIGYDSNINASPGLTSVAVPAFSGSILAIEPAGTRKSGDYLGLGAGVSGRLVLDPRWSLIGTATARFQKFGADNGDLNTGQVDGLGGLAYRLDRDEFSVALQTGMYEVGGTRVRNAMGAVGEWTHRFDAFRQIDAYVQRIRLTYPQAHFADADRTVVGATYAQQVGNLWGYGGAYAGREEARDPAAPYLGHRLWGVRGGMQFPVMDSVTGLVAGSYENRDYGGVDPLFLVPRHDRQTNFALGLSWRVAEGYRIVPQWSWARTTSSDPLAAYHKTAFSVALRRDF